MTEDDIALEYEMYLATEGKNLKTCFKCEATTHRDECPLCNSTISGDKLVDEIFDKIDAGEDVDLDKLLSNKDEWEAVTIDEGEQ